MLYGSILGIHVFAWYATFLLLAAGELLLVRARSGQRKSARLAFHARRCADVLAGIGFVAGIVLIILGGWSLLTPWLLASFTLLAILMLIGRGFVRPWEVRADVVLRNDASDAQVRAFAGEMKALYGRVTMIAVLALIAGVMTMKPQLF
jgi:NAD(P)-dependent dehydrogenase (short-subunit alcohol dehydrogenase family)